MFCKPRTCCSFTFFGCFLFHAVTSVGIISAYGLDRNHFDIIIQLKPNANRETDDFNEGKGVSHFTEKLEVCHL